jgi:hypothetical protein
MAFWNQLLITRSDDVALRAIEMQSSLRSLCISVISALIFPTAYFNAEDAESRRDRGED